MGNPVVQWQIVSRQPDQVAAFYSKLFGWNIVTDNAIGYRQVRSSGIDGGIWPSPPEGGDMVQLFIKVDDVDAHLADAVKLGAKVLVPATALPDGDRMAILIDPTGISFGLVTSA
jgi:predicted enzyme related to lactoylglutathione lyase